MIHSSGHIDVASLSGMRLLGRALVSWCKKPSSDAAIDKYAPSAPHPKRASPRAKLGLNPSELSRLHFVQLLILH